MMEFLRGRGEGDEAVFSFSFPLFVMGSKGTDRVSNQKKKKQKGGV